ncbi:MAG: hypothetical protein WHS87_03445 [Anaerolineales bacterium]
MSRRLHDVLVQASKVLGLLFVFVLLVGSVQPSYASPSAPRASRSITGTAQTPVGFAVSQPLSMLAEKVSKAELAPEGDTNGPVREFRGGLPIPRSVVREQSFNLPNRTASRPNVEPKAKVQDEPPAPGLDAQWAGLSQGVNRVWYGYGVYPPDTQGDVSATHYIQVVNIQMAIWDLMQTNAVGGPVTLFVGPINTLWKGSGLTACEESADGDPIVLYDEYADRWLVSQFALPNFPSGPYYECIAISQTGDPMGSWYLYQYSFPVMNDYPKFGVWHDGYYMSINQFAPSGSSLVWAGQGVVVFDKAAMQSGDPTARMIYIDTSQNCTTGYEPECFLGGMLPADADGTTPPIGPEIFMQFDDDAWGYSPDQLQLWTLVPDWGAGTATFSHLIDLPTAPFDSEVCPGYTRNCIPQQGTSQGLDAISDRLMYRLHYRNFGSYQAMVVNHTIDVDNAPSTVKGRAGVRWYELRDTGSGWGIYQQGNVDFNDGKNRWMASAALDDVGNIAIGYSVSSDSMYPGIWYTVHLASDPIGTVRTEKPLVSAGGGAQTGTGARWGDYSMMSVYPQAAGGCDFFYTTEYLRGTTPAEWYTWIGVFHNQSCYTGDLTTPDTTINSTPGATIHSHSATFTFSGSDDVSVSGFECSLDGSAFSTCTSPKTYTGLSIGNHHFEVRAVDSSGNVDPTPATFDFTVDLTVATFTGTGSYDGFIIESGENSGVGGSANATAAYLKVGDTAADKQIRSILDFNTATLPDNAVVVGVYLKLKKYNVLGTDPFTTHGNLWVDVNSPFFGGGRGLALADFAAAPDAAQVGFFNATPDASNWYTADIASAAGYINRTGATQFRIYFNLDDNDDLGADLINFYSGNAVLANRPVLIIEYYVP